MFHTSTFWCFRKRGLSHQMHKIFGIIVVNIYADPIPNIGVPKHSARCQRIWIGRPCRLERGKATKSELNGTLHGSETCNPTQMNVTTFTKHNGACNMFKWHLCRALMSTCGHWHNAFPCMQGLVQALMKDVYKNQLIRYQMPRHSAWMSWWYCRQSCSWCFLEWVNVSLIKFGMTSQAHEFVFFSWEHMQ